LKLARDVEDARAISSIHIKTATVLQDAGEYGQALALLRKTIDMMQKQGDRRGELWALGGMGIIQGKMGEYERALSNLHKAVKLRSQLGFTATEPLDLDFHISEIYEGFKDFERALEHYHKALAMAQIAGTKNKLGKIYDRIGNIYYRMEEYEKAKEFLEDALRVHTEANNPEMRKSELIRLGDISSKLGKPEAALDKQLKALSLTREMEDARTEAKVLTRIGTLYQILGRPRTALDYYREAKDKRTAMDDRRGVNENLLQIALVTSILGNFRAAVSDLKEAFEIAQRSEDRSMLWKAYFIMGRALQGKGRLGEALESYRKAITILEAMEADIVEESPEDNFIFGGKTALFETTLRALMKLARKDPKGAYDNQALRIVEKLKAAAFENTLSRINVQTFSDLPRELVLKEKSLKLGLRQINARISSELSKVSPDNKLIQKLLADRRTKEKLFAQLKARLEQDYPSYSKLRYPKPVTVHRLQRYVVDPDEAILEYVVTRSRTHVFAIDKQRFYTYSIDYPRKDLERDVLALTKPLHRAEIQAGWDPSVAYRLYSYMIKPVESFLAGKKTVTVIPDGPLNSLPFEILVTSKAHAKKRFWSPKDRPSYLVERYAFCYSPSAAVLSHLRMRKREKRPGWNLVAFGDAVYGGEAENGKELNQGAERLLNAYAGNSARSGSVSLRPLNRAQREVKEIAKIVGGRSQTYFGKQATETLFKKADLSRYSYVHLATQGVLLSGGRLWQHPAVAFSLYGDRENDGFLELGEVFGLRLNADLVVLSSFLSSDAGVQAKTEGLLSLARAFLFSGTESVILGMWQGRDDRPMDGSPNYYSAVELLAEMYSKIKNGSKAEALRQAKLMLLKDQRTSHPYFWAPFILIGDWRVPPEAEIHEVDHKKMRFKGLSTWRKLFSR
jgi:CHAT domain-containing protein/Tfp pilus assembly protein PilF